MGTGADDLVEHSDPPSTTAVSIRHKNWRHPFDRATAPNPLGRELCRIFPGAKELIVWHPCCRTKVCTRVQVHSTNPIQPHVLRGNLHCRCRPMPGIETFSPALKWLRSLPPPGIGSGQ